MGELGRYTSGSIVLEPDHHIVGAQAFILAKCCALVWSSWTPREWADCPRCKLPPRGAPHGRRRLLVSDAGSEFSAPEMTLLRQVLLGLGSCSVCRARPICMPTGGPWSTSTGRTSGALTCTWTSRRCQPNSSFPGRGDRDVELNAESNVTELVASLPIGSWANADALLLASTRR